MSSEPAVVVYARDPGQHLERERQQRVARQDRHGFAEDFMAGELAAAVVVIIERRQIVVDQRVGVDELERAGGGGGAVDGIGDGGRGREAEQRADALAAGEQAVAHGAMDGRRRDRFGRDQAVEFAVHDLLLAGQKFAEAHPLSGRNGSA